MDVTVLNKSYEPIAVIDTFKSLIWTKRYYKCGDFELYLPADPALLEILKQDYFLVRDDDDSVMVIENIGITTDAEDGDYFIIRGRSLESILYRRIFNRQFTLNNSGTLAEAVQAMVTECITNHDSTPLDPRTYRNIAGLTVDLTSQFDGDLATQFLGQTLFDGIVSVCQPKGVGIKMTLSSSVLLISLYQGSDNGVVFSPEYDNLVNSKYSYDMTSYANYVAVAGEGEGEDRVIYRRLKGTMQNPPSGLDLREWYVDARNLNTNGGEISFYDYTKILGQRADDFLAEHAVQRVFESEVDPQASYKYKTDWNLGDIVTITNEYGVTSQPRIVEVIESWDDTGYTVIPTFDSLGTT